MNRIALLFLSLLSATTVVASEKPLERLSSTEKLVCKQTEKHLASCLGSAMKFYNCQPRQDGLQYIVSGDYISPLKDRFKYIVIGNLDKDKFTIFKIKQPGIDEDFIPYSKFQYQMVCN